MPSKTRHSSAVGSVLEYTEQERKRVETAVREYDEQRSQWTFAWFFLLLIAVLVIGYLLGKHWG
jgi:hypothetical protein